MKIKVVAIVPAAGLGKRFSTSKRKTFVKVAGTPLLIYTLKKLHNTSSITEIIPVLRQEDMERGFELIKSHNLNKIKQIAPGGKERQDSVCNALNLIKKDCIILIHDGVRPFISNQLIKSLLLEIKGSGLACLPPACSTSRRPSGRDRQARTKIDGVVPGLPVKETLKKVDRKKGIVLSTIKREKFWTIQTPQVFPFAVIKKAYDKACKDGFYATDDAALVERIGGKVKIITGSPFNIKITTPEDIDIAEFLLKKQEEGQGQEYEESLI